MNESSYAINEKESSFIKVAKTIAMIMVVFIHAQTSTHLFVEFKLFSIEYILNAIQYIISELICRSSVPVFFIISAILLYRKKIDYIDNIRKKCKTLIVPYIIFNTLWIIIFAICQSIPQLKNLFNNPNNNVLDFSLLELLDCYFSIKRSSPFLYPLWFLRDLIVLNCISPIIDSFIKKIPKLSLLITGMMTLLDLNMPFLGAQSLFYFMNGIYTF